MKWYKINNISEVDSPGLVIYPSRIKANIELAIDIAGDANRLRPHIKTHKMREIIQLHGEYGIYKFKCATIAEAEMAASAGAKDIIIAHQPTLPKIPRLLQLIKAFPATTFKTIVDNIETLQLLNQAMSSQNLMLEVLVDIDNGYQRSGMGISSDALAVYKGIHQALNLSVGGLHVYDGHITHDSFIKRKSLVDKAYREVEDFIDILNQNKLPVPLIVCGGSPSFPVHAQREGVELSPGTFVFWDAKMVEHYKDMPFEIAALVVTRIISKLTDDIACVDLGHKSIASEMPHPRVKFLNCEVKEFLTHSEEHLVIQSPDLESKKVGDVLYGIPYHICPTVALHEEAHVIQQYEVVDKWQVIARKRKITI